MKLNSLFYVLKIAYGMKLQIKYTFNTKSLDKYKVNYKFFEKTSVS